MDVGKKPDASDAEAIEQRHQDALRKIAGANQRDRNESTHHQPISTPSRIQAADPTGSESGSRRSIASGVRQEVWRRDQGRCVDCGSRVRLEYDHIIPFSKGGSNTARNIELRCEACNRQKAARI